MKVVREFKMRGTKRQDFVEYFLKLSGGSERGTDGGADGRGGVGEWTDEKITGYGWNVEIGSELPGRIGAITFPDVDIRLEAEEEIIDDLVKDFRSRFMTSGG